MNNFELVAKILIVGEIGNHGYNLKYWWTFSLGPALRPGGVMVLMCVCVCVCLFVFLCVCPPTRSLDLLTFKLWINFWISAQIFNHWLNLQSWVQFWIIGELFNHGWTFSLGPAPRSPQVLVLMCVSLCLFVCLCICPPTRSLDH